MASISSKSLGTLIRIADSDGGEGAANYEIADINNFVSGGVVLVRKNIHSKSAFGSSTAYPGGTLDNKMTSIYNSLPEKLQSKIMDATFALEGSGSITRKVFALTYTMAGFGDNNGTTEGKALQHYNSNANRIKKYSGSAGRWWLSSRSSASGSRYVDADGAADYYGPSYSFGVVPAFIIPQSLQIEDSANTDGSYNIKYTEKISCTVNMGSAEEMPKSALPIINCNGNLTLQICNNANDAAPAWEAAINETVHTFANATKTADQWAIGLNIDITRTAGENLFLNEPIVLTM
ncbi:MAG: hypothetical protein KIG86_06485 [Eubacteriales bacterium]|nr:hypothetical protein [Eubacteriales bacterium]